MAAGKGQGKTAEPEQDFMEALRARAAKIKEEEQYTGRLTPQILQQLEPLLYEKLPSEYIEFIPKREKKGDAGLPYDVTGVRSSQIQMDVMNAVLGLAHWRMLTHYTDGGSVCKSVIIVGNDLHFAALDDTGTLLPVIMTSDGRQVHAAEVLVERSGWGGHTRGSSPGDIWKGAETNSAKRVLARFGPGHEVYRGEFDDDPRKPEFRRRERQPQAEAPKQEAPKVTTEQAEADIEKWTGDPELVKLEGEDDPVELGALVADAVKAMDGIPDVDVVKKWALLKPRIGNVHQLRDLIKRAENAVGSPA